MANLADRLKGLVARDVAGNATGALVLLANVPKENVPVAGLLGEF